MSDSRVLVGGFEPFYTTDFGAAYVADALDILKALSPGSVNLVLRQAWIDG